MPNNRKKTIGCKFGKLTVIKEDGKASNGAISYLCECECGSFKTVSGGELRRGKTSSCGHCSQKEYIGKRYGSLVIDKFVENDKNGFSVFSCSCDCGNKFVTKLQPLKNGKTSTCGKCDENNLIGKRFGKLTVKKYNGVVNGLRNFLCVCDCGNEISIDSYSLKSLHTKSCGCLRSGAEQECINYFNDNNISFESNVKFDGLLGVNNGNLSYDFLVDDTLIECQGKQHYEPIEYFGGKEKFAIQTEHDEAKRLYAKENGYKLLEIKYDESPKEVLSNYFVI